MQEPAEVSRHKIPSGCPNRSWTDPRDILGAKLVAHIDSVKETRAVRQRADGERKPSAEVMTRLRHAYRVAALLAERDSRSVVQAWFQGMKP